DRGGINYGNRLILGRPTEPIPGPTALMLLAVQGHGEHPRVAASAFYLTEKALAATDLEHLCWARLALDAHQDQPGVTEALPAIEERTAAAQAERGGEEWLRPAPLREALTALARGGGAKLFRVENVGSNGEPPAAVGVSAKRKPLGERVRSFFRGVAVQ